MNLFICIPNTFNPRRNKRQLNMYICDDIAAYIDLELVKHSYQTDVAQDPRGHRIEFVLT